MINEYFRVSSIQANTYKSAIGEPQASGNWSPEGTSEHRQGWSREATEPLLTIKNNLNPERSERVPEATATH